MKRIKLWYPSHILQPHSLLLDDDIASALVRAGVAAAANPVEAGALGTGGALSAETPVTILVPEGAQGEPRRIVVPAAVAAIAASGGRAAIVAADVVITPTPSPSASFAPGGEPAITTLYPVANQPMEISFTALNATSAFVEIYGVSNPSVTLASVTVPL